MATTCDLPTYDICINEGTDYELVTTIYEDDGVTPIDLTGASASLNLKFMGVLSSYPGVAIGNSFEFLVPHTVVFSALCGTHQIDYTVTSGETKRLLRGDVEVERKL